MRHLILLIGLLFASSPALADSNGFVNTIGSLIAGERFCGLEYDEDVLTVWIDDRVPYSDKGFYDRLDVSITRSERQQYALLGAARQAHCRAVFDTANRYGFLDTGYTSGVTHATKRQRYSNH